MLSDKYSQNLFGNTTTKFVTASRGAFYKTGVATGGLIANKIPVKTTMIASKIPTRTNK